MRLAAEKAIQEELPEILAKENLPIVEAPKVSTDTPERGKVLSFTARAPLAPEIELPDYKSIGEKLRGNKEDISVTDEEHNEALTHLKRERARIDKIEAGEEPAKASEAAREMKEEELPAIDDAFAQAIGYENAEAFSKALRENIKNEKEFRAREKVRAQILDELAEKAKISYPALLKEYEIDDMQARLTDDLSRMGHTLDAYLAEQKKTPEELRKEWEPAADRRAKVRLILGEIARKEALEPDPEIVEHELVHAKEHFPSGDETMLRMHVVHALRNEMVLRFLESGEKQPLPPHNHEH